MSDTHGLKAGRAVKAKPLIVQPIWDRLDHAVIVTDCELTAPGPTIRYVNRAFTRLTGYRADEVIGRSPRLLQCSRTDRGVVATIRRDLHESDFCRATLTNRRKDGTDYLCALVITPLIGPTGETEHFICVAEHLKENPSHAVLRRDSDELEQAQTRIQTLERHLTKANDLIGRQQSELAVTNVHLARSNEELRRLRAADADKLQLLASASHDLRQPVMSMGLFLDVLRHRIGEAERPILGGLLASHVSIRTLLDGMLDTARLDAGALDPTIEPVPIAVMLDVIKGEFMLQAEMRGLRLRVMPCTATVSSDAQLLERILRNLVANALKYTTTGGILLGCRQCHAAEGGRHLRIEVWDTGPGIAENSLRAIFEEFRQLDNRDRNQTRGVGLGLAIVARLAKQLNHRIGVRSWPGRGSVFSVTVPLAPKHSTSRGRSRAGQAS
ncbi:PAS domain-containing sensor histidine kinase [Azospirillum sp.]|uniref:PAS domain-containing sensor histidine kinase n=1 Tax=Azospirillum sp. TaxID=34012 RepID=UPI002D6CBF89|nr:ATP-binding protein [Azospirillum sp.]HYF85056.1 ATP-binding protein [Azospirillum sp.]